MGDSDSQKRSFVSDINRGDKGLGPKYSSFKLGEKTRYVKTQKKGIRQPEREREKERERGRERGRNRERGE